MSSLRLPDCKCAPYYPAGPGAHHSNYCATKRNQKLSDAEAVTYRALLREARAANGEPTTHPTTWESVTDAPTDFRWSLAVWQRHGFGRYACTCAHCRFTESQELPDWDLYDKDRKERSDAI